MEVHLVTLNMFVINVKLVLSFESQNISSVSTKMQKLDCSKLSCSPLKKMVEHMMEYLYTLNSNMDFFIIEFKQDHQFNPGCLTLLHSERPKLYAIFGLSECSRVND